MPRSIRNWAVADLWLPLVTLKQQGQMLVEVYESVLPAAIWLGWIMNIATSMLSSVGIIYKSNLKFGSCDLTRQMIKVGKAVMDGKRMTQVTFSIIRCEGECIARRCARARIWRQTRLHKAFDAREQSIMAGFHFLLLRFSKRDLWHGTLSISAQFWCTGRLHLELHLLQN